MGEQVARSGVSSLKTAQETQDSAADVSSVASLSLSLFLSLSLTHSPAFSLSPSFASDGVFATFQISPPVLLRLLRVRLAQGGDRSVAAAAGGGVSVAGA